LPVDERDRDRAARLLADAGLDAAAPLIGVVPGAAAAFKRWPADRFVAAAQALLRRRGEWRLVVLGSPGERRLAAEVAHAFGRGAVSLAGRMDLLALRGLVAGLRLLLTNDTGPLHVAVAVGTPTVSLFGATDSRGTGPLQDPERHTVIQRPLPSWNTTNIQRRSRMPMLRIEVDEVVAACEALLGRSGQA